MLSSVTEASIALCSVSFNDSCESIPIILRSEHPIYNNSARISQETHDISASKPNWLMLFRETVAVYCENHTEHTDTLCEQNAEFITSKQVEYVVNTGLQVIK
jgi:hypothetical protein